MRCAGKIGRLSFFTESMIPLFFFTRPTSGVWCILSNRCLRISLHNKKNPLTMASSDNESTTNNTIPPLSLDDLEARYPNVFRVYVNLSDREKSTRDCLLDLQDDEDEESNVNDKGLCTKITGVDFTRPIHENNLSMHLSDDAYKYTIFLWKLLSACESGSIGGEACRMYQVLCAALDDAVSTKTDKERFERMMAWTIAASSHGLHQVLYRGEPETNQALFREAGNEWKKIFEKGAAKPFLGEATRTFATGSCDGFHKYLLAAKKEYGSYAKYSFNFIKKTRKAAGGTKRKTTP